jgi:hypothetical protein
MHDVSCDLVETAFGYHEDGYEERESFKLDHWDPYDGMMASRSCATLASVPIGLVLAACSQLSNSDTDKGPAINLSSPAHLTKVVQHPWSRYQQKPVAWTDCAQQTLSMRQDCSLPEKVYGAKLRPMCRDRRQISTSIHPEEIQN